MRRRVLPFLARVCEELAVPMLFVSHDPRTVQALADEVIALREGRVIAQGAPREVLADPVVFPIAEEEGFETVFPAVLESSEAGGTVVRLGATGQGPRLVVPRTDADRGDRLLVGIPSREPILATVEPTGLSARNVLPGQIVAMRQVTDDRGILLAIVSLCPGLPPLVTEVTVGAAGELGLVAGLAVFVVLKSAGCVVYGGGTA